MRGSMVDIQSETAEIRRRKKERKKTRMWTNALRDGRPVEYGWRPLFNAAKFVLTLTTRVPCRNAAKTRNQLTLAGVPKTRQQISAVSGLKFSILRQHVEEILLFNKIFPIVNRCLSCEDMTRQSCVMVRRWRIFGDLFSPAFPASLVHHISDLHSISRLGHIMCVSMVDIQCATAEIQRGKKGKKERRLECGPMLNVMAALSNMGGVLCSTPQSLADAHD